MQNQSFPTLFLEMEQNKIYETKQIWEFYFKKYLMLNHLSVIFREALTHVL